MPYKESLMPNSSYMAGYRFERRVMERLRGLGWTVFRQGKSKFPDIFALKPGKTWLVECKYGLHPRLSVWEREELARLSVSSGATAVYAHAKHRRDVEFEVLKEHQASFIDEVIR